MPAMLGEKSLIAAVFTDLLPFAVDCLFSLPPIFASRSPMAAQALISTTAEFGLLWIWQPLRPMHSSSVKLWQLCQWC
jgi:hypothetical protein